jgi:hypothetical protein
MLPTFCCANGESLGLLEVTVMNLPLLPLLLPLVTTTRTLCPWQTTTSEGITGKARKEQFA